MSPILAFVLRVALGYIILLVYGWLVTDSDEEQHFND